MVICHRGYIDIRTFNRLFRDVESLTIVDLDVSTAILLVAVRVIQCFYSRNVYWENIPRSIINVSKSHLRKKNANNVSNFVCLKFPRHLNIKRRRAKYRRKNVVKSLIYRT